MKEQLTHDASLDLLVRFADLFAVPVEGHAREELTRDQEEVLRKLAAGELGPEERSGLIPLLAGNERALEFLAEVAG